MRHAAAARREIGVRTVFNILGPLCNPARVKRQVIGIYDPSRLLQMAEVIAQLGAERALVVCGPGHADELLPTGDNQVAEWDGHAVRCYRLRSEDVGLPTHPPEALAGGDADDNAQDILSIAQGRKGPKCDTALLNAGTAIYVSGNADSVADGIAVARNAVAEGRLADLVVRAASASCRRSEETG
jgi:anthranilate phosphoribosyltransferase